MIEVLGFSLSRLFHELLYWHFSCPLATVLSSWACFLEALQVASLDGPQALRPETGPEASA